MFQRRRERPAVACVPDAGRFVAAGGRQSSAIRTKSYFEDGSCVTEGGPARFTGLRVLDVGGPILGSSGNEAARTIEGGTVHNRLMVYP